MADAEVRTMYEYGNHRFFVAQKQPDGTFGAKEYHEGIMELKIDFKNEVTEISAEDDPGYIVLRTPATGEGTIKFAVLPYAVYSKLFDVIEDKNGVTVIKADAKAKEVACGYYSNVGDGSESMFTMYRAVFDTPSLAAASFDGKSIRDLTLNVKVYPLSYTDAAGKRQMATYSILNSIKNQNIWDKVQDTIYIPDSEVPA